MSMKLSNPANQILINNDFDLEHETKMTQARILSTFLEIIDERKLTQIELENLTGLKQPFLSGLFNLHRKLNMEHIALFQRALKIKLQPPEYLSKNKHVLKNYTETEYEPALAHFKEYSSFKDQIFLRWISPLDSKEKIDMQPYTKMQPNWEKEGNILEMEKEKFKEIEESYK